MPIIRINPSYGSGYGYGGIYNPQAQIAKLQLQHERARGAERIKLERLLWAERMKTIQMKTAMQLNGGLGVMGAVPLGVGGLANPALIGAGAVPGFGGIGAGFGMGMPMMMRGGQLNPTNQSAVSSGGTVNQNVTNNNNHSSNVSIRHHTVTPGFGYGSPFGSPYGSPFGGSYLPQMLGWH